MAGLVVASYSGEDYSHYLASSSLGTWLKEQNVPAVYGLDTRALTKKIRREGSMLGRLLQSKPPSSLVGELSNRVGSLVRGSRSTGSWRDQFEAIDWIDPNKKNLVAGGIHTSSYSLV